VGYVKKACLRRQGDDPLDPRFANASSPRASGSSHSLTGFARGNGRGRLVIYHGGAKVEKGGA